MYRHFAFLRVDRQGIGGFIEAILAVMIVTSGCTILLVSVNLVQSDEGGNNIDAQEEVRRICQGLMNDERIFRQPYILLLSNSYLWSGIVLDAFSGFPDYVVTLFVDLESPRSILLAQKGFEIAPPQTIVVRIPVDVQFTLSTVHVGILEVRVGA